MTFNVNTDVNYAAYQTVVATLDAYTRGQFDAFLVKEFANQTTAGATLTTAIFDAALTAALQSARSGDYQF